MVLPEGVSYAMDDDFYMIDLSTARTTAQKTNTFTSALQSDGSVRVFCGSTNCYTFDGSDGDVAVIKVKTDADVSAGTYTVTLKNIEMSDAKGKTYKVATSDIDVEVADIVTNVSHNKMDQMQDGKYIINNRLVIKKGDRINDATGEIVM